MFSFLEDTPHMAHLLLQCCMYNESTGKMFLYVLYFTKNMLHKIASILLTFWLYLDMSKVNFIYIVQYHKSQMCLKGLQNMYGIRHIWRPHRFITRSSNWFQFYYYLMNSTVWTLLTCKLVDENGCWPLCFGHMCSLVPLALSFWSI